MSLSVRDIQKLIEKTAKPEYAYDWDNCGLQVGDPEAKVEKVLICLDVTRDVIAEAKENACQMIISHHPLIFKPVKTLTADTAVGDVVSMLYKNNIALYCAHTNLDIAFGGVNDALCRKLELENVSLLKPFEVNNTVVACARKGKLKRQMNRQQLIDFVKEKTGAKTLLCSLSDKMYSTVALSTGAGGEFLTNETDVFITGEIKYHEALEAKRQNISFIAIGHYYSEAPFACELMHGLQNASDMLQYGVSFVCSQINTDPFD